MAGSGFDPVVVPDEFWTRREVIDALQRRDFAALFQLLRRLLGASQFRIGLTAQIGQHRVSMVMNRKSKITSIELVERIASGLRMPDHARAWLGLAPLGATPAAPSPPGTVQAEPGPVGVARVSGRPEGSVLDVRRRTLILALAALSTEGLAVPAIGGLSDRQMLAQTLRALDQIYGSPPSPDEWNEIVAEHGQAYVSAPRLPLLERLTGDLASIHSLMSAVATSDSTARSLADAGGNLAALVAMTCTDLGYGAEALHSWRMARRLADDGGNPDTRLWVRGREAMTGLYLDRPVPALHSLITDWRDLPGRRVAGLAILLAARAQAYSIEGRPTEALAALDDVQRTFEALPESATRFDDSILGWSASRFWHTTSYVRATCGGAAAAEHATETAVATTRPSRRMTVVQLDLHRALRLVTDANVADGIRHACTVLDETPRPSRYVGALATRVLESVPASRAHAAARADLRDRTALAFPDSPVPKT